jgi:hypothetical protein
MTNREEKGMIVGTTVPKTGGKPLYFGVDADSGFVVLREFRSLDSLAEMAETKGYKLTNVW